MPSYGSQVKAWIGRSEDSLKQEWGAPSQQEALAGGGEILIYDRAKDIKTGGGTVFTSETQTQTVRNSDGTTSTNQVVVQVPHYTDPVSGRAACQTRFEVGADHIVKSVKYIGEGCVA